MHANGRPAMPASSLDHLISQIARSVRDPHVLGALRAVPRERFVSRELRPYAHLDEPLPIGAGQTISQPTIVAVMTAALHLTGEERVLEVGTGSGYQAAVLSRLAREVVTVEVVDELRDQAAETLAALGYANVRVLLAGEEIGALAEGPYDAIIVTAAAPSVPAPLVAQLRVGGRLMIPVGTREEQDLLLVERTANGTAVSRLGACRFVPLVGKHGFLAGPVGR